MLRNALLSVRRTTVRTMVGGTVTLGLVEYTTHLPSQGRSSELYHKVSDEIVTPLMRKSLDPEVAHNLALEFAQRGFALTHRPSHLEHRLSVKSTLSFDTTIIPDDDKSTKSNASNEKSYKLVFPNAIGLAAGFDKDGQAIQPLLDMGFGSVEIGSVTPKPQPGNAKPRMFRLVDDLGIINRYGFNSKGANEVETNLKAFRESQQQQQQHNATPKESSMWESFASWILPPAKPAHGLVGINIGKNKTSEDATSDYVQNIQQLGPYADYIVINISSPNTPNLRDLQKADALSKLVGACLEARNQLLKPLPLLVKLAPDLTDEELKSMIPTLRKVDGVVVTNTTNARPEFLISSQNRDETGGLSGAPLKEKSTEIIRKLYAMMEGDVFIIGVGGVGSGEDAYEKFKAGASIVQIYSMMIYKGPGCISRIRHDLADLLDQNGHNALTDIIGRDHEEIFWKKQKERQEEAAEQNTDEAVIVAD